MAINAQTIRNKIPVPKISHTALAGWTLFLLGAIWLYDAYDGRGKQGPWPVASIFPW